jgi:predicted kinase/GNAT superfamily N-acetyltransferase
MAQVHLIYGPQGAGKSTLALKLATEEKAVRFSIDEWMQRLFGDDRPDALTFDWVVPRLHRCEGMIWSLCRQILAGGGRVVLDLGFMQRANRDRIRLLAEAEGAEVAAWFLDAPRDLRRQRVMRRNEEKGETYSLTVSPGMFDAMDGLFQPPDAEELAASRRPDGFRPATAADAAMIRDITRAAYARWVPVIGREPRPMVADYAEALHKHRIDLWQNAGTVCALIEYRLEPDHLWIENIAVLPEAQGQGIGRRLLAHAEAECRAAGLREIRLLTNAAFEANLRLYEACGYQMTGTEPFMGGTTAYFAKTLTV